MSQKLKPIRIHVSSPSDVRAERDTLADVVAKIQHNIGQKNGVHLQLVKWEDSAMPALGKVQEVINRQIPATDIFIGIYWSRFSTPIAKAGSGTEEEFHLALDSFKMLGRPHILLYFCDRALSVSHVDTEQLFKIQKFRDSIAKQALYSTFSTVDEFKLLVQQHLIRLIPELSALDAPDKKKPPRIFYSYAHEDEELRGQLAKHLRVLERKRVIESWYDDMIAPGAEWSDEIVDELKKADIIVLLVSSDFLDSDYCYSVEMQKALERHNSGDVRVLPVIVRSAMWEESPLASLKALPKDAKPITLWNDRDEAWTDVARGIRRVAHELTQT